MPMYAYRCSSCDHSFDRILKVARCSEPQECPECEHSPCDKLVVPVNFNLTGDGWASKNGRIAGQMRKKNERLDAKQNERKRDAPIATLVPNVGGERVDSWAEAKKLAVSKGKVGSSYDAAIRKEKAAKQ